MHEKQRLTNHERHIPTKQKRLLTGSDDDGGWFVVDGHCAVVGGDRQPARHLVQPAVHVRTVRTVAPGTMVRVHDFGLRRSFHLVAWRQTLKKM